VPPNTVISADGRAACEALPPLNSIAVRPAHIGSIVSGERQFVEQYPKENPMKIRVILSTFAMLLLIGVAVGTADPAATTKPATAENTVPAQALSTALPDWSPGCVGNSSVSEPLTFNPAPTEKDALPCSCGYAGCQGLSSGSVCAISGAQIYKCFVLSFCSGAGSGYRCSCSTGPL